MIDIGKFAQDRFPINGDKAIAFGISNQAAAAELRAFADKLDAGEVNVSRACRSEIAQGDEWVTSALYIEFEELPAAETSPERKRPEPIIERPSS